MACRCLCPSAEQGGSRQSPGSWGRMSGEKTPGLRGNSACQGLLQPSLLEAKVTPKSTRPVLPAASHPAKPTCIAAFGHSTRWNSLGDFAFFFLLFLDIFLRFRFFRIPNIRHLAFGFYFFVKLLKHPREHLDLCSSFPGSRNAPLDTLPQDGGLR